VLLVPRPGADPVVVKDYGPRPRWVRRTLAPWLLRRELRALERAAGLPGVPAPVGRVGSDALAMEYVDGIPLRRHWFPEGLPPGFFDALDGILAGLAERGMAYLDLRSPTNVLCTPRLSPALVDLASTLRLPIPRRLLARLHRSGLEKLRRRFEAAPGAQPRFRAPGYRDLKAGGVRLRFADRGRAEDPVPALLLHDAGLAAPVFEPCLERAGAAGRRAVAVDLPGFGGSARPRRRLGPEGAAARLLALLDALRLARVDLVGEGWGGLVARHLARRAPERVRALLTLDTPVRRWVGECARSRELARHPARLRARLHDRIPEGLAPEVREELGLLVDAVPVRVLRLAWAGVRLEEGSERALADPPAPAQPWLVAEREPEPGVEAWLRECAPAARLTGWAIAGDPDRLWRELAALSAS
jgi:pimeloyl-ACP methyl ester carboxylesterase